MRIAQISYFYRPIRGGQEVYIKNLFRILNRNHINSIVYQKQVDDNVKYSDIVEVKFPRLLRKIFKEWNWHLFTILLIVFKYKKLKKEDVFICHYAMHSPCIWFQNKRAIILSHGIDWKTSKKRSLNDSLKEFIAKKSLDRFIIVANDTHYFRHLGYNVPPAENYFREIMPKKWFIPNCIDTNKFQRNDGIEKLKEKKIILVPRMIHEDRGIHLAIETYKELLHLTSEFQMYIIGGPLEGKYYEYCKSLVTNYNLTKNIIFIGYVPNDNIVDWYSSAEITLIPTLRREGTSLSALESMACKTLTISTNLVGLRDLPTIQGNPCPHELSKLIFDSYHNKKKLVEWQYTQVKETFNFENWEKAWISVIESAYNNE